MRYIDATPKPQTMTEVADQPDQPNVPHKYRGGNTKLVEQLVDEVLAGVSEAKAVEIVNRAMTDPQFAGITKESLTFHRIHFDDGWMDE